MAEADPATKACPQCGETILAVAVKCKHCQSVLTAAPPAKSETLGWLLLAIPTGAMLLIGTWGGEAMDRMDLEKRSGPTLTGLGLQVFLSNAVSNAIGVRLLLHGLVFLTILLTAILCAIEARKLGMGRPTDPTPKGTKWNGPASWFFGALLLWPVVYPLYLNRRKLYGVHGRFALGLLAMLFLISTWALMSYAITDRVVQLQDYLRTVPPSP